MINPGTVHVVVPDGIDDPARPSGGNVYDRRVCGELADSGWSVRELSVPGSWPYPNGAACAALAGALAGIPDGGIALVDGLIASAAAPVLLPEADRLRLVVLVHMPVGDGPGGCAGEGEVLRAAAAVVTTSTWTRRLLLTRYALRPGLVHVAQPGVDPAEVAPGTASGGELLCVAAVAPHKGHDVLFAALAQVADLRWRCVCVGAPGRDPGFADQLGRLALECGDGGRICLAGPLTGADLDAAYASADLLVLASYAETYGMVVAEALARGVPVVATDVGGISEALGDGSNGGRPGLLVPAGDSFAFAAALRSWLSDAELRREMRQAARERRESLAGWSVTADRISQVLLGLSARPTGLPTGLLR